MSFLVLFISFSCDDSLDINTNPLAATSADPNAVLPFVFTQYSNRKVTELGTRTQDVPQHMSFNFNSPRRGNTSIFLTGNSWNMYYTQVLGNLTLIEQDARAAGETSNNITAIAVTMKAYMFYELSSIWEEVPFSQAQNGQEFPSPTFDDQETILRGVVDFLDEAVALIDATPATGTPDVSVGDLIYGGDMDKWRRFANSLRLRVLMMIRNVDTSVDGEIQAALSQPLIETADQAAILTYRDEPGQQNAWQQIVEAFFGPSNEGARVHCPSPVFYDLLVDSNDPREDLFIFDPEGGGPPDYGFRATAGEARFTDNIIRNDLPDMWYLPAETSFYRAELALKGVGSGAQAAYEEGVTRVLEWWGQDIPGVINTLSDAEISAFVGSLPAVTLQGVHEQQFMESFLKPVISWVHVRRTNVPALDPPSNTTISSILKRFNYPPAEVGANPNTPANLPTDTPMWFEN